MSDALLQYQALSLAIGGRAVLQGLALEVHAGEVVGLVGASGSGKSLALLAACGLLPEGATTTGQVCIGGEDLLAADEATLCKRRGASVGIVFQEPATALNPVMTIGDQVAEVVRRHRPVTRQAAAAAADAALAAVGLDAARAPRDRYPHELSGGQRQRVAIALATVLEPAVLLCDEPTTALDVTTQAEVLALLRHLAREKGLAVLIVSHDLPALATVADRLALLHEGVLLESGTTADLIARPQHELTRALIAASAPPPPTTAAMPAADSPILVEASGLAVRYAGHTGHAGHVALQDIAFTIAAGERVGVLGESGSGKSTLARAVLGLQAPSAGTVTRHCTVHAVFQDPAASLDPRWPVGRSIAEGAHGRRSFTAADVGQALEEVGLPASAASRLPHAFSGGERQRLALARALAAEPQLLVLDEAVSALDAAHRMQVLALLDGIARRRNLAWLWVSHDVQWVRATTHRALVLLGGRIVEAGPTAQVLDAPQHPYTARLVAASPHLPATDARAR